MLRSESRSDLSDAEAARVDDFYSRFSVPDTLGCKDLEDKLFLEFTPWIESALSPAGTNIYRGGSAKIDRRGAVPPSPVDVDLFAVLPRCISAHDTKNYGDTDENVYRRLFRSGSVRLSFRFQDEKKKGTEKILYYIPPDADPGYWDRFLVDGYSYNHCGYDFVDHLSDFRPYDYSVYKRNEAAL